MENLILVPAIMTVVMLAVTVYARRIGNEKRDVVLLGSLGGLSGLSTAVAAII